MMKAKAVRAMPKSGIAAQVAESTGLKKSQVAQVLSSLADVGAAEVGGNGVLAGDLFLVASVKARVSCSRKAEASQP